MLVSAVENESVPKSPEQITPLRPASAQTISPFPRTNNCNKTCHQGRSACCRGGETPGNCLTLSRFYALLREMPYFAIDRFDPAALGMSPSQPIKRTQDQTRTAICRNPRRSSAWWLSPHRPLYWSANRGWSDGRCRSSPKSSRKQLDLQRKHSSRTFPVAIKPSK